MSDALSTYSPPAEAMAAYRPVIRRTIGFWVGWAEKDGRTCAMVAADDDRRAGTHESRRGVAGPSQIPKGMIVSIDLLRIVAPKRA